MPSTTAYEFGDVVLVTFPFTDQTGHKKRPALVVSSDAYHAERSDLILLAVTSQVRPVDVFGEAAVDQWKQAGLLRPSVVKPVAATIEKRLVLKKLGRLQFQDRSALQRILDQILGS